MNPTQSTATSWHARGSLILASATLLSSITLANPGENDTPSESGISVSALALPPNMGGLREALLGGTFWANFRYRYENVDQDAPGITADARASTLRTRLGYRSGDFHGFTGVLEFSDVSNIGAGNRDYNDGNGGGATDRPVVPDSVGTQVNQVYLDYSADAGDIRIGRQRIELDNERFIANHGWRQTEQNYDAIRYNKNWEAGTRVFYAYVDNVNTINFANQNSNSHLLNLSHAWENVGRLTFYGYYLDYDYIPASSTFTYGGRFAGEHSNGDVGLIYTAELANQRDAEDNTNDVDAMYSHVQFGGTASGAHLKIGFESLEGDSSGNAQRAFQTPLGALHIHNGFADLFTITPAAGLEDTYLDLGYSNNDFGLGVVLHQFEPERSSAADYGEELDIYANYNIAEDLVLGAKFADFDSDDPANFADTQKFWFWLAFEF